MSSYFLQWTYVFIFVCFWMQLAISRILRVFMKITDIHLSCYLQDFRPADTIIIEYNTLFSSFVATLVILSWTPFAPLVLGSFGNRCSGHLSHRWCLVPYKCFKKLSNHVRGTMNWATTNLTFERKVLLIGINITHAMDYNNLDFSPEL